MARNLVKNLDDTDLQIIGLEFTIQLPHGLRQELAMFSPEGLVIPRVLSSDPRPWGDYGYTPQVTFHSTDGDFTVIGYGCPW
jgi:hypothetical protein